ncbi:MAG: glycine cleavage system protein GcvH [Nitrospinae bacterium]|nr:glycine cleavage system protein GcvH [Nitrospinota bacterium]
MECPDGLHYTKDHEWGLEEDGTLTVGITDYAQGELGDVVYVELPEVGTMLKAGEPFGVVESVKSVSDLYSPCSGEVLEINPDLESEPETVNSSPYDRGWMIKVAVSDPKELEKLLSAEKYLEFVNSLK